MKRSSLAAFGCLLLLLSAAASARAATYNVGPASGQIPNLAGVPWGALQPGDIVNIHAKPGGYHEIIQISAAGTAAQPITIRGIRDPLTNELPVIDGDGAVMDPHVNFRSPVLEPLGVIIVTPRQAGYIYGQTFPAWINIESLAIRNAMYRADGSIHFTDQHGVQRLYDGFACGIYIEFAHHLTIRGCEISNNGNGIFANSKNGAAQSSKDLLIEKNYIHSNGQPSIPGISNGFAHHNIYVECVGAVYQYNRFGPLRPDCHGCMIKDRSSGTTIRFNEIVSTDASAMFAILDPQGGSDYIDTMPDYRDAFVYGNVITLQNSSTHYGINLVWFGAFNGVQSYPKQHRGTLHFFHNTVVNHQTGVAAFSLTDPAYSGTNAIFEKVDARNNVFFTDSAINANIWNAFHLIVTPASPVVDLGLNWVSPGTLKFWTGHPSGAVVNGWGNLIVGDAAGKNLPGFANINGLDYHLTSAADSIDAAGPLAAAALAGGHDVTQEYSAPQSSVPRVVLGAHADLGAFETSAVYTPPPINHAPFTMPQSFNLTGNAPAAITLGACDPDGDPLGYYHTVPGLVGTLTGTGPNLTYTPPAGSGSIMIGYSVWDAELYAATPGFVFISFNAPGNPPPAVALTNPANAAVAKSVPVALTATASDANGVKKVEFYVGPNLVGTALAAPYTLNWSSSKSGRYQIVAKAFDNLNACSFSQPRFVVVE
jgi:hypothetical protein